MIKKPKVSVVVLNWNGSADTLKCLSSLERLSYSHCEVIVVDNGSSDGSVQLIRSQFPKVQLLETGRNLGYAGGNNVGISAALKSGADYLLLLNNDTVVDPDLVTYLVSAFQGNSSIGIVGARIYLMDSEELDHLGGIWNGWRGEFDLIGWRAKGVSLSHLPTELDYVCGAALMISKEALAAAGDLDTEFFLYWEDADLAARVIEKGFSVLSHPEALIWHRGGGTMGSKVFSTYFHSRGRLLWIQKHCSFLEKLWLSMRILGEFFHLVLQMMLYSLQMGFISSKRQRKKRERLLRLHAKRSALFDFLRGKFNHGPDWIYKTSRK